MVEKTIRCTRCREEFTDEESKNITACPKCGTKGLPMLIKHDLEVKINWQELRILASWAQNWVQEKFGDTEQDSKDVLSIILKNLKQYRPDGAPALTLMDEMEELQEMYPDAVMMRGNKMIVPPKGHGES